MAKRNQIFIYMYNSGIMGAQANLKMIIRNVALQCIVASQTVETISQ